MVPHDFEIFYRERNEMSQEGGKAVLCFHTESQSLSYASFAHISRQIKKGSLLSGSLVVIDTRKLHLKKRKREKS